MQHLHPRAVWLFFLYSLRNLFLILFFFGFYLLGAIFVLLGGEPGAVESIIGLLVSVIAMLGLTYGWAKLQYKFYKYELKDNGFSKELGVITKKYVTIPYDRIQNVDIYRGIFARLLGLSDLNIQTAGASGNTKQRAEGRLPALLHKDAEALRDELIKRAGKARNNGL